MKNKGTSNVPVTIQTVRNNIYQIERNGIRLQVVLDRDLAKYYGVDVKRLNEQINRANKRGSTLFKEDMFDLTKDEWELIKKSRSQFATLGKGKENQQHTGGFRPKVYTARGAIAVSKVVNSDQADEVYKVLVDAFIYQQSIKTGNAEVSAERFDALEKRVDRLELKENIPSIQTQITTNNTFNDSSIYVAGDSNRDIKQELENKISLELIKLKEEISKSQIKLEDKDQLKETATRLIVEAQKGQKKSFGDTLELLANSATIYGALPMPVTAGIKAVWELGKRYLGL